MVPFKWQSLKSRSETRDPGPGTRDLGPETQDPGPGDPEPVTRDRETWDPKTTRLWELASLPIRE